MERLLEENGVLLNLCSFTPTACVKLRKVSSECRSLLSEERLEWLLPELFDKLSLFDANPFELCNDIDQLWLMVVHGLNLKSRDSTGATLLQTVVTECQTNPKQIISMLVERGASINAKGASGYTPLHAVCYTDNVSTAAYLLERGANPDALSANGSTPLLIAAREGRAEMTSTLLAYGADPDDGGDRDWSPLLLAAGQGHYEAAFALLEYGADPNLQFYQGRTALHEAVDGGHVEVCKLLLSFGASLKIRDESEMTPLDLAVQYRENEGVLKILKSVKVKKRVTKVADRAGAETDACSRGRGGPQVAVDELIDL